MPLLRAPDGAIVNLPDEQVSQARAGGYQPVDVGEAGKTLGEAAQEDTGALGGVNAFTGGVLSGLTLGGSDYVLQNVLDRGQLANVAAQREQHPIAAGGGQVIGAILPSIVAPESVLAQSPAGLLSRGTGAIAEGGGIARSLVASGVEGAVQNAGMYLSDTALGNRDLSAEGIAGALGSGLEFGVGGGAVALGIEKGTIAARRMFSRIADGSSRAATEAEQAWKEKFATTLEANDAAAEAARAKLAEAKFARQQAGLERDQATAAVAEAKAGVPEGAAPAAPGAPGEPVGSAGSPGSTPTTPTPSQPNDYLSGFGLSPEQQEVLTLKRRAADINVPPEEMAQIDARLRELGKTVPPEDQALLDLSARARAGAANGSARQAEVAGLRSQAENDLATALADHDAARADLEDVLRRIEAPEYIPPGMAGNPEAAAQFAARAGAPIDPRLEDAMRSLVGRNDVVGSGGIPVGEFGAPGAPGIKRGADLEPRPPTAVEANTGDLTAVSKRRSTVEATPVEQRAPEETTRAEAGRAKRGVPVQDGVPAGFNPALESDGTPLFQGQPKIRTGVPNRRQVNRGNFQKLAWVVKPSELAERGVLGMTSDAEATAQRIGGVRRAWAGGDAVPAVEIDIDKRGRYFIASGNKRVLAAAMEGDRPVLARFRPIADEVSGMDALADPIRNAVAGKPLDAPVPLANSLDELNEILARNRPKVTTGHAGPGQTTKFKQWWWIDRGETEPPLPEGWYLGDEWKKRYETKLRVGEPPTPEAEQVATNPKLKELVDDVVATPPPAATPESATTPPATPATPATPSSGSRAPSSSRGTGTRSRRRVLVPALVAASAVHGGTAAAEAIGRKGAEVEAGETQSLAATQQAVASNLGVEPAQAQRVVAELRDHGLIDSRGEATVIGRLIVAADTGDAAALQTLERIQGIAENVGGKAVAAAEHGAAAAAGGHGVNDLESLLRGTQEQLASGRELGQVAAPWNEGHPLRGPGPHNDYANSAMAAEERALQAEAAARRQLGETQVTSTGHPLSVQQLEVAHDAALERAVTAVESTERATATADAKVIEQQLSTVGARPGAVEDIAAVGETVTRYERAAAKLTDALGDAAPPAAKEAAAAVRTAEDAADRKAADRTARAIDDHVAAQPQPPARSPDEIMPGAFGPSAKEQRVAAAEKARTDATAKFARARANETDARLGVEAAQSTADKARTAAEAARPAATPGHGQSKIGAALTALGVAGELGVPGIPHPKDIPVIGPLLSAYVKYRAIKAAAGRFAGRVPATADAKVAAVAARTKDHVARAVDTMLGIASESAPKMRGAVVATATVLERRIFDDGQPDAPRGASTQELAAVRIREIATAASRPDLVQQMVRQKLHGVMDPDLIAAAERRLIASYQYLASTMPKAPAENPYIKRNWVPSPGDTADLAQRIAVMQHPEFALQHPTPATADTLRNLSPQLLDLAKQRLLERVGDLKQPVPRPQLLRAGLLFDVPLAPDLEFENIQILQDAHDASRSAPSPMAPQAPGAPPVPSVANPIALNQLYQPPGDRRAARM